MIEAKNNSEDLRKYIAAMRGGIDNSRDLIQQLLAFGRKSSNDLQPFDLTALVTELSTVVRRTFGPGVYVNLNGPGVPVFVHGNRSQLYNGILNLCMNARDALPEEGGVIDITVQETVVHLPWTSAYESQRALETMCAYGLSIMAVEWMKKRQPIVSSHFTPPRSMVMGRGLAYRQSMGWSILWVVTFS